MIDLRYASQIENRIASASSVGKGRWRVRGSYEIQYRAYATFQGTQPGAIHPELLILGLTPNLAREVTAEVRRGSR